MEILLLRHGDAGPYTSPDEARELSRFGTEQIERIIALREAELGDIALSLVSPYVRAQQTANILLSKQRHIERKEASWACPNSSVDYALEQLYQLSQTSWKSVILVSHNPFLSKLALTLCGDQFSGLFMDTGSMVAIDCDVVASGCGTLKWVSHA